VLNGRAKDVRGEIKKHNQYASKWKSAATKYVKAIKGFEKLVADKNRDCCIYKKASMPAVESTPPYLECDFKKESVKKCTADAISAMKSAVADKIKAGAAKYKSYKSKCETLTAKEPKDRRALRRADSNCDKQAAATRASRRIVRTDLPKLRKDFKRQKLEYHADYKKYWVAYKKTKKKIKKQEYDRNHEWTSVMEIKCLLANYKDGGSFDSSAKTKCSRQTQEGRDYFGHTHKAELKLSYPQKIKELHWRLGSFDALTNTKAYQSHCSQTENIPPAPQCSVSKKQKPVCKHHGVKRKRIKKKAVKPPNFIGARTLKGGKDNKYCADEGNTIKCDRNRVQGWEKFVIEDAGSGKFALRGGKDKKYCTDEGNTIKCNRNRIQGWEKFAIEDQGGGWVALRGGKHNKYCADEGNKIKCNRNHIQGWEKFFISSFP